MARWVTAKKERKVRTESGRRDEVEKRIKGRERLTDAVVGYELTVLLRQADVQEPNPFAELDVERRRRLLTLAHGPAVESGRLVATGNDDVAE